MESVLIQNNITEDSNQVSSVSNMMLNIFNQDSLSNDSVNLSIENDGFAIFAAPGKDMEIDSNDAPSDFYIFIERKNKKNQKDQAFLPEPLAEVKNEI